MNTFHQQRKKASAGFSLLEMLVAIAILSILFSVMLSMVAQAYRVTNHAEQQTDALQQSERVMQFLEDRLRGVTLATTPEFFDAKSRTFAPAASTSEHLEVRPQAATSFVCGTADRQLGLDGTVYPGACLAWASKSAHARQLASNDFGQALRGFLCLVEFGNDSYGSPATGYRYRLLLVEANAGQFRQHVQSRNVDWHRQLLSQTAAAAPPDEPLVLADNVVALLVQPLDREGNLLASNGQYDSWAWRRSGAPSSADGSFNRLPDALRIGIVSISENSAKRLEARYGNEAPFGSSLQSLHLEEDWQEAVFALQEELDVTCELELNVTVVRLPHRP